MTINAGHNQDIWVGMCGELAGMKKAIPILLGLGLDEFSMVPRAIPEAKQLISQLSIEEARAISDHVMTLSSAKQVEDYMEEQLNTLGIG
jgi:phosphoenolpyruvate-protein kinase (PTS system EI component)